MFFSGELGQCNKFKAKLQIKENPLPVLKPKRNVSFVIVEVNKEFGILKKMGEIGEFDYPDWPSPAAYVQKSNKFVHVHIS